MQSLGVCRERGDGGTVQNTRSGVEQKERTQPKTDFYVVGRDPEEAPVTAARDQSVRRKVWLGARSCGDLNRMGWRVGTGVDWPSRRLWCPFGSWTDVL